MEDEDLQKALEAEMKGKRARALMPLGTDESYVFVSRTGP
jgi:hypothetical protein